jgi:hypothetical protein
MVAGDLLNLFWFVHQYHAAGGAGATVPCLAYGKVYELEAIFACKGHGDGDFETRQAGE